jgi:hypothetical protein
MITISEGKSRAITVLTLVAVLVTLWRVRYLGFFSDDWLVLSQMSWSQNSLSEALSINSGTRPIYGLIFWTLNSIAGGDPARWQVISSLTVLLSSVVAFRLFQVLLRIMGIERSSSTFGSAIGVLLLVFSPWTLALFAWPIGVLTIWSFIFVGEGLTWSLNCRGPKHMVGVLLLLLGFLTYEAYWLLPAPMVFLLWGRLTARDANVKLLVYAIPLALAIGYQRLLISRFGFGNPKPASFDSSLAVKNIVAVPDEFMGALQPIPWWMVLLGALGPLAMLVVVRSINSALLFRILGLVTFGALIAAMKYAVVGYPLSSRGVMSRTFALPVFFVALAFAVAIAAIFDIRGGEHRQRLQRAAGYGFAALFLGVVLFAFASRLTEWSDRHRISMQVLNALTMGLNEDDVVKPDLSTLSIVVQIEGDSAGNIFGAVWELSGAVGWQEPVLVPDRSVSFLTAREGAWRSVWTGSEVVQSWCHGSLESVVSRSASTLAPLYIRIQPETGIIERGRLEAMQYFGCDGIQPSLSQPKP